MDGDRPDAVHDGLRPRCRQPGTPSRGWYPELCFRGAVRRDKGQKRPPCGECPPTLAPGTQVSASREATPAFCPCRPRFPPPHSARAACERPPEGLRSGPRQFCFQRFAPRNPPLAPHLGPDSRLFRPFPSHPFEARSMSLLRVEILRWDADRDCRLIQQRRGIKVYIYALIGSWIGLRYRRGRRGWRSKVLTK